MSKKYRVDGKPRKSGAGKFFLGLFLGFVICVATVFGFLWFAYENVSVKWLNETFNIGLDLGSQEINDKTLKELIATAASVVDKVNTYTLNDIDYDFGISLGDKFMGIDISDVKNVPVKDLPIALQNKFANISADELKDVIDLTDAEIILNLKNTYYVSNGKLYEDVAKTKEVDLDVIKYVITSESVVIKKQTRPIRDGKVEFELRYLPLTKAFGDFKNTLGDRFTVGDLVNEFNVNLPSYIVKGNENKTINQLEGAINELLLADFLGFEILDGKVYNGANEVTGIVATLAKKTVDELNGIEDIIDTSSVADVLGFTYNGGVYKDSQGNVVTGIMKAIAGTEVKNLSTKVNGLTLNDVLDPSQKTGVLTLIGNPLITEIGSSIQSVINTKTINELAVAGVINVSSSDLSKTIKVGTHAGKTLGSLKLTEIVDALVSAVQ